MSFLQLFQGAYAGILALVFIFSIVVYFKRKNSIFALYAAYIVMNLFHGLYVNKLILQEIALTDFFAQSLHSLSLSATAVYFPFMKRLIDGENDMPPEATKMVNIVITFSIVTSPMIFVLAGVHFALFSEIHYWTMIFFAAFGYISVIGLYPQLVPSSRIILSGIFVMATGALMLVILGGKGYPENHTPFQIALLIEILTFSYILFHQYAQLEFDKQKALIAKDSLKGELLQKDRELANKALLLAQNEESLLQFQKQVSELANTENANEGEIKRLTHQLVNTSQNNSWNDFETQFLQVHPKFYQTLNSQYPDLTPGEQKVCVLLNLNLNTKDIADILSKSVKSVEVARSRIRKKLNLERSDNLIKVLQNMNLG
jgi:DNA-binding CsgD family transcriptional regulator